LKKIIGILLLLITIESANAQSKYIDSLQQIVALHKKDTIELNVLLLLSNEFSRRDLQKAKQYSLQAMSQADVKKETKWLTSAYGYLVTLYQQSGQIDSAHYFLDQAEALVRDNPNNVRVKFNFNQSAGLFYKNLGDYKKALPYVLENINIWKKEDENRAGQLLNLGNLYFNMGDFKNAANSHLKSLQLFEILKNLRGQSFCFQSLGNDFFSLNQYSKAEKYYERSLALKEQLGDKRGVLTTTISLGDVYKELNQNQKAEVNYKSALATARGMKLVVEEARILHQTGLLYKRMNNFELARENFNKSIVLSEQLGDSTTRAKTKSELIGLDVVEQNKINTETELLNSLNTVIRIGDRQQQSLEYLHLSDYYRLHKDYERALYYFREHKALSDSVEGNAVLLQLKELEEQYQNEKHTQEITLLKKNQELQALALSRERTNVALIAFALLSVLIISILIVNRYRVKNRANRMIEMERMRNTIARDLHDDIGSTLSSINIMSQLALNENGNAGHHLKKIATHSAQMMENMSDIVWSINPKNDLAEQMVFKMKEFAAEILEPAGINYSFQVADSVDTLKLDSEKRKNLFLIFKEAINNAAKYSDGTNVTINLFLQSSHLHLEVVDNGKGFNKEEAKQGNGLSNMKDRATAITGALQYNTEPGKGTRIQLAVPIT
jgi:two-component system, NarL family, sensor histidine kinase UhpB